MISMPLKHRRGPRWWPLRSLLSSPRHPGVLVALSIWLGTSLASVGGGILNVQLGWNAIPIEVFGLTIDFTFYPPLVLAFLLAIWLGPSYGASALYVANLASSLVSGVDPMRSLLFALVGPLEICILWSSMVLLQVSPHLRSWRDRWLFLSVILIGPTAASLASPIWNAAHGLDVIAGLQVWRGWVLGDVTMLLFAAPILRFFTRPVTDRLRRTLPSAPRNSLPYSAFLVLVLLVFVLLGALMTLGVHDLVSRIALSPELMTPSGEPLIPRLREISLFLASLFVVLMATAVLFTTALSRRGRADHESAVRDPLTGCLNRRFLSELFEENFSLLPGSSGTVALLDVDHFKRVNDVFGHLAGDQALRHLADRLRAHLREADTLFRWGGEEFLFVLPDTPIEEAEALMEAVGKDIAQAPLFESRGQPVTVTVSSGVCSLSQPNDLDSLLDGVDRALYRAKSTGRDRVVAVRDQEPHQEAR